MPGGESEAPLAPGWPCSTCRPVPRATERALLMRRPAGPRRRGERGCNAQRLGARRPGAGEQVRRPPAPGPRSTSRPVPRATERPIFWNGGHARRSERRPPGSKPVRNASGSGSGARTRVRRRRPWHTLSGRTSTRWTDLKLPTLQCQKLWIRGAARGRRWTWSTNPSDRPLAMA
jgi:hypothetical protein